MYIARDRIGGIQVAIGLELAVLVGAYEGQGGPTQVQIRGKIDEVGPVACAETAFLNRRIVGRRQRWAGTNRRIGDEDTGQSCHWNGGERRVAGAERLSVLVIVCLQILIGQIGRQVFRRPPAQGDAGALGLAVRPFVTRDIVDVVDAVPVNQACDP